jgi:hypothetical protein
MDGLDQLKNSMTSEPTAIEQDSTEGNLCQVS